MPHGAADRRAVIEEFARTLAELRESAGTPSWRAMSGRSGCISHTTLHEAAQGNRLPTWETTSEFVTACDGDPADFRERWLAADAVVNPPEDEPAASADPAPEPAATPVAPATPEPGASPTGAASPTNAAAPETVTPRAKHTGRRTAVLAAALAAVVAVAAVVIWQAVDEDPGDVNYGGDTTASGSPATGAAAPTSCPVTPTNPPSRPPTNAGDKAKFLGDVTVKDCTVVAPGSTFRKVWRLQNAGSVAWTGRTLQRLELPQGRDDCQTVERIQVPTAKPGATIDLPVQVTAPTEPGICVVRWAMKDDRDRVAFPGGRPLNFQVVVRG